MATENNQQSRLFIIIAIGLVGTMVLGLLGIGGITVLSRLSSDGQRLAMLSPTPTMQLMVATPKSSPTPTVTLVPILPTPTATSVVSPTAPQAIVATATPKPTGPIIPAKQQEAVPQTGFGESTGFAMGFVFFGLAFLSRLFRNRR